ncbi:hypothetical protein, partial [Vibrio harveyi]|uniref:hypothetical protein n=1 Tax=Vibrio harveyi TaxID=669 RepID=UPI003CF9D5F5
VVESKPLIADRDLQGLKEAVQQLVIKEHDVETPYGRVHCTMKVKVFLIKSHRPATAFNTTHLTKAF